MANKKHNKTRKNKRLLKIIMGEANYGQFISTQKQFPFNQHRTVRNFYSQIIQYLGNVNLGSTIQARRSGLIDMFNGLLGDKSRPLGIWGRRLYSQKRVPVVHIQLHDGSSIVPARHLALFGNDPNPNTKQYKKFQKKKIPIHAWKQRRNYLIPAPDPDINIGASRSNGLIIVDSNGVPLVYLHIKFLQFGRKTQINFNEEFIMHQELATTVKKAFDGHSHLPKNIMATVKDQIAEYNHLAVADGDMPVVSLSNVTRVKSKGIRKNTKQKKYEHQLKFKTILDPDLLKSSPIYELIQFDVNPVREEDEMENFVLSLQQMGYTVQGRP